MTRRERTHRAFGRAYLIVLLAIAAIALIAQCISRAEAPGGPAETPSAAQPAEKAADRFLKAFRDGHYDDVWTMLTPEAQQRWPDAEAYGSFLSRKFGSRKLAYQIDRVKSGGDASSLTVVASLSIQDSGARYEGPPLLLVRKEDSWLIGDAGPLGPLGAVIPPAVPLRPEITVPIMIYHRFAAELPADFEQRTLTVDTSSFRGQLAWLSGNGYSTITLAELFNAFYYDLPLPAKPIVLVIDDGFADAYLEAFPLLQEYGFGATVAMITGAIGQSEYLNWDQIREMSGAGVEFVSHTANHADLAAASAEVAQSELADSKRTLEEGRAGGAQFLVYPYGQPFASGSSKAQDMILGLLPQEGYVGALTTSSGPPYISAQSANLPYQLHRIPVSGGESLARFAASIGATP